MNSETTNTLLSLIRGHYEGEPPVITENSTFEEIEFDSLDMIELIMEIEKEFHIKIYSEEEYNFDFAKTIADIVKFINDKLSKYDGWVL